MFQFTIDTSSPRLSAVNVYTAPDKAQQIPVPLDAVHNFKQTVRVFLVGDAVPAAGDTVKFAIRFTGVSDALGTTTNETVVIQSPAGTRGEDASGNVYYDFALSFTGDACDEIFSRNATLTMQGAIVAEDTADHLTATRHIEFQFKITAAASILAHDGSYYPTTTALEEHNADPEAHPAIRALIQAAGVANEQEAWDAQVAVSGTKRVIVNTANVELVGGSSWDATESTGAILKLKGTAGVALENSYPDPAPAGGFFVHDVALTKSSTSKRVRLGITHYNASWGQAMFKGFQCNWDTDTVGLTADKVEVSNNMQIGGHVVITLGSLSLATGILEAPQGRFTGNVSIGGVLTVTGDFVAPAFLAGTFGTATAYGENGINAHSAYMQTFPTKAGTLAHVSDVKGSVIHDPAATVDTVIDGNAVGSFRVRASSTLLGNMVDYGYSGIRVWRDGVETPFTFNSGANTDIARKSDITGGGGTGTLQNAYDNQPTVSGYKTLNNSANFEIAKTTADGARITIIQDAYTNAIQSQKLNTTTGLIEGTQCGIGFDGEIWNPVLGWSSFTTQGAQQESKVFGFDGASLSLRAVDYTGDAPYEKERVNISGESIRFQKMTSATAGQGIEIMFSGFRKFIGGASVTEYLYTFPATGGTLALASEIKTYTAGSGISVNGSNVISLNTATNSVFGGVKLSSSSTSLGSNAGQIGRNSSGQILVPLCNSGSSGVIKTGIEPISGQVIPNGALPLGRTSTGIGYVETTTVFPVGAVVMRNTNTAPTHAGTWTAAGTVTTTGTGETTIYYFQRTA